MAAVIQITPLDDLGREILDELEERIERQPTEIRDDGTREYRLEAHDDGFEPALNHIDPDWSDHLSRTMSRG